MLQGLFGQGTDGTLFIYIHDPKLAMNYFITPAKRGITFEIMLGNIEESTHPDAPKLKTRVFASGCCVWYVPISIVFTQGA